MITFHQFSKPKDKKKTKNFKSKTDWVSHSVLSILTAASVLTFANVGGNFFAQEDFTQEKIIPQTLIAETTEAPFELTMVEVKESKESVKAREKAEADTKAAKIAADLALEEEKIATALAQEETLKASQSSVNEVVTPPIYSGGGSKEEWMTAAGIAPEDWGYVDFIVSKESGWNPNAVNSSSGASGLVQALPCGKVPGSCFNPVDNLRWANSYAQDRYSGGWEGAYLFWQANHWW